MDSEKIAYGILCLIIGGVGLYFAIKHILVKNEQPYEDRYGNKLGIWAMLLLLIIMGFLLIGSELFKNI